VFVTWLSTRRSGLSAPSSRKTLLPPAQQDRVDHQPEVVDEAALDQRLHELGAPDHVQIGAVLPFSATTASARSPWSSVEFCHASGSESVVEGTYFGFVFSGSGITCSSSGAFGQ
jgi:hypothetical protein